MVQSLTSIVGALALTGLEALSLAQICVILAVSRNTQRSDAGRRRSTHPIPPDEGASSGMRIEVRRAAKRRESS